MEEEKKRTGFALSGAVLAALTASLCCILPFLAAVLGVAGLGASEYFARLRPYLLVITSGLLALGFYLAYRPATGRACETDSLCARKPVRRWNRAGLWLAALAVAAFASFPYYGGRLLEAASGRTRPGGTLARTRQANVVLKIEGMDCPVCAGGLQNRLRQISGVYRAEVNFHEKQVVIAYDPRAVDSAHFEKVIREAGFRVARPQPRD